MISPVGEGQSPAAQIEEFVKKFTLDEAAAEALRNSPSHIQEAVLARGELTDVRNPSSAVMGRLRDAQNGWSGPKGAGGKGGGGGWFGAAAWGGSWGGGAGGQSWGSAPAAAGGEMMEGEVDEFIRANELDERASDALKSCTPSVQRTVLDRGNLQDTRNPSSALLGRIRDAQSGKSSGGGKGAWGAGPWAAGPYGAWGGGFGKGGFGGFGPYGDKGGKGWW